MGVCALPSGDTASRTGVADSHPICARFAKLRRSAPVQMAHGARGEGRPVLKYYASEAAHFSYDSRNTVQAPGFFDGCTCRAGVEPHAALPSSNSRRSTGSTSAALEAVP